MSWPIHALSEAQFPPYVIIKSFYYLFLKHTPQEGYEMISPMEDQTVVQPQHDFMLHVVHKCGREFFKMYCPFH